jgi:polyphosphate kinase 2 (PPK2 family)
MTKQKDKLSREAYELELLRLQTELCHLQESVRHKGLRVIFVFEGRDAAGKGGTMRRITERVSPRVFRTVALPAPSDREKTQLYAQRFEPPKPGKRKKRTKGLPDALTFTHEIPQLF